MNSEGEATAASIFGILNRLAVVWPGRTDRKPRKLRCHSETASHIELERLRGFCCAVRPGHPVAALRAQDIYAFGRMRAAQPLETCPVEAYTVGTDCCWTAPVSVFRSLRDTACHRDVVRGTVDSESPPVGLTRPPGVLL